MRRTDLLSNCHRATDLLPSNAMKSRRDLLAGGLVLPSRILLARFPMPLELTPRCAPGSRVENFQTSSAWLQTVSGPSTRELSASEIRPAFPSQLSRFSPLHP